MPHNKVMRQTTLRPARAGDFAYCERLYFAGMDAIIRDLQLDRARQTQSFRRRWALPEVRIIMRDGVDVGWLQSRIEHEALFLAQLFVDAPHRCTGIGTQTVNQLIGEAAAAHRAVTLGVVKSNPALRLYQRLGFHTTHEDERKFYMRREPATAGAQVSVQRRSG